MCFVNIFIKLLLFIFYVTTYNDKNISRQLNINPYYKIFTSLCFVMSYLIFFNGEVASDRNGDGDLS